VAGGGGSWLAQLRRAARGRWGFGGGDEEDVREKERKNKEKERGIRDISPFTRTREVVLSNVSLKRLQLPHRILSISTAGALPNALYLGSGQGAPGGPRGAGPLAVAGGACLRWPSYQPDMSE
jgi:hypothetical protein